MKKPTPQLPQKEAKVLFQQLKERFDKNMHRHKDLIWDDIARKLLNEKVNLSSLYQMEITGGEPDVVQFDSKTGEYLFFDCAKETPKERRSLCYDQQALEDRKEHKPKESALGLATAIGIKILNEEQYRYLQSLEPIDLKTSSWIQTPDNIRKLGGALFCDCRYGQVFTYHNGAISYYAARGFRGALSI